MKRDAGEEERREEDGVRRSKRTPKPVNLHGPPPVPRELPRLPGLPADWRPPNCPGNAEFLLILARLQKLLTTNRFVREHYCMTLRDAVTETSFSVKTKAGVRDVIARLTYNTKWKSQVCLFVLDYHRKATRSRMLALFMLKYQTIAPLLYNKDLRRVIALHVPVGVDAESLSFIAHLVKGRKGEIEICGFFKHCFSYEESITMLTNTAP